MTSTRRHKIARSAVIRRVKPRKSEKAKRSKAKTFKRKSRNNVMRGGIHKNLKVYVIQKKLGKPKCYIIRELSWNSLDTLYMFFDEQLQDEELKTFLCAALNLDKLDSLQPQLTITEEFGDKVFKSLFVKLSGIRSYTLSSGKLPQRINFPLSKVRVTNHKPDFKIGNGEEVIQRLKAKTEVSFTDYTFTEKTAEELKYDFSSFDFTLSNLNTLFDDITRSTIRTLTEFCNKPEIMGKVDQLRVLIDRQSRLSSAAENFAKLFSLGKGRVKNSKDDDKNSYIEEAKIRIPFTAEDITKAGNLIQEIKESPDYQKCYVIISDDHILDNYLNRKTEFKTIEDIFNEAYSISF